MIICKYHTSPCDMCDAPATSRHGAACLAQGATGRWCEVLWICPACATAQGGMMTAEDAAFAIITREGGKDGWVDFEFDEQEVLDRLVAWRETQSTPLVEIK